MAANYTLKISSVCAGGEHITLQLYKDAVAVKKIIINKTDAMQSDVDISDTLILLIRQAIQNANATTNAARKAAIEGMVITL